MQCCHACLLLLSVALCMCFPLTPDPCADVVYLDAKSDTYLEEVSSCNIFVRKGKTIKTPPLGGTILPGESAGWAHHAVVSLSQLPDHCEPVPGTSQRALSGAGGQLSSCYCRRWT